MGKEVKKFKEGDQVFGYIGAPMGANAEYMCMPEDKMIGLKPENMTHEEAACLPYGAIMASSHLKKVDIRPGMKVLINGASGGIGTFAVQISKSYDTEVTGVCSTANLNMVKSIGADHVIDYTKDDFTQSVEEYDIIFDAVRKSKFKKCKNALTSKGVYVTTEFGPLLLLQMKMNSNPNKKRMLGMLGKTDPGDLAFLRELIEGGKIKPVIDRTYPLEEIADAHRYVDKGHAKGRVIIKIG